MAYKQIGEYGLAEEAFFRACDPKLQLGNGTYLEQYDIGLNNLGLLAYAYEKDALAEKYYTTVLSHDPINFNTIWNLSLVLLRKYCSGKGGDLRKYWEMYNYRFKRDEPTILKNDKPELLTWDMETPYPDDSIVVLIEQGMGDAIMFGRYLPELKKYFSKVIVQCTPEMNDIFSDYETCIHVSDTDAKYGIPTGNLGLLSKNIPDGNWLAHKHNPKTIKDKLNIACVWQGSKKHINDFNRSCPAGYFDRLAKYGDLHSINNPRMGFINLKSTDWKDTIKYLESIDLVISVDTSIVHLCGSLDIPCWVLMPLVDTDFRWGDSSAGYNNMWYDSVDVFRNPNSWETVFNKVEERLDEISKR